jgi:hypothetical protein
MPVAGRFVTTIDDIRLRLAYHLDANYLRNPRSIRAFNANRPTLDAGQLRIVQQLHEHGISTTHFRELFGDDERWKRMCACMQQFIDGDTVQQRLGRQAAAGAGVGKDHLIRLFTPFQASLPVDDPWLQLGLDSRIHDVVNSYLGLWTKLHSLNLWYTLPHGADRPRIHSQRWHRDPEDALMVKVFMYFSEVSDRNGPLQYIPGSCSDGPYSHLWPFTPINPDGYPPQDELEERIPATRWVTCAGGPGTMVFCNTSGFHRGGYAVQGGRALAFWTFVSPACLWPRQFAVDWHDGERRLSRAATFALA